MATQLNQGLIDGLACLNTLAASAEPLGGRELARRVGIHHVKVNRLLMTLAEVGLVRQNDQRRYLPAGGLHVLAALALHGSGLLRRARPVLADLHARWPDQTLAIGARWQDQVTYLYHHRGGDGLGTGSSNLIPAEHSSVGQVLLAAADAQPGDLIDRALQHGDHWSIAVPIWEHDEPVAALALTNVAPGQRRAPIIRALHDAAHTIAQL